MKVAPFNPEPSNRWVRLLPRLARHRVRRQAALWKNRGDSPIFHAAMTTPLDRLAARVVVVWTPFCANWTLVFGVPDE